MLVALAAVWFIVFLPSVTKRNQDKDDASRERRVRREQLTANSSPLIAQTVARAKTSKVIFGSLTALAAVGAVVAILQGSMIWASAALGAMVVFALISRAASLRVSKAISTGTKRRTKIGTGLDARAIETFEEADDFDQNSWRPTELPDQTYQARVGTLENPTLADVVEIEFSRELERETLDEILRRRRAN